MLNRRDEEAHLLQAHSHVAAATARIAGQCLIIGRLRARGLDTSRTETCLRTMENTLSVLLAHKDLIEGIVAEMAPASPLRNRAR